MKIKFFEKAKLASIKSTHQFKVGATLVLGKNVYSGWNNVSKTHSKTGNPYGACHAEFTVIRKALTRHSDLSGAELYVYRTRRMGGQGLSKPCKFCFEFIKRMGIKRVFYSGDTGYFQYNRQELM